MNAEELYEMYANQSFNDILSFNHYDVHEDGHRDDADVCAHGDRHDDEA